MWIDKIGEIEIPIKIFNTRHSNASIGLISANIHKGVVQYRCRYRFNL